MFVTEKETLVIEDAENSGRVWDWTEPGEVAKKAIGSVVNMIPSQEPGTIADSSATAFAHGSIVELWHEATRGQLGVIGDEGEGLACYRGVDRCQWLVHSDQGVFALQSVETGRFLSIPLTLGGEPTATSLKRVNCSVIEVVDGVYAVLDASGSRAMGFRRLGAPGTATVTAECFLDVQCRFVLRVVSEGNAVEEYAVEPEFADAEWHFDGSTVGLVHGATGERLGENYNKDIAGYSHYTLGRNPMALLRDGLVRTETLTVEFAADAVDPAKGHIWLKGPVNYFAVPSVKRSSSRALSRLFYRAQKSEDGETVYTLRNGSGGLIGANVVGKLFVTTNEAEFEDSPSTFLWKIEPRSPSASDDGGTAGDTDTVAAPPRREARRERSRRVGGAV